MVELVPVSIRGRAFEGEGYEGRGERLDDVTRRCVAGCGQPFWPCFRSGQAVQSGQARSGFCQGKSFDGRHSIGSRVPPSLVSARVPAQCAVAPDLVKAGASVGQSGD